MIYTYIYIYTYRIFHVARINVPSPLPPLGALIYIVSCMLVTYAHTKNLGVPSSVLGGYTKSCVKKNINPNDGRIDYKTRFQFVSMILCIFL